MERKRVVIIGAGPAGLSAAYEVARLGGTPLVLEKEPVVGGIARTARHGDNLFDVGGHRFFTKNRQIAQLWDEVLAEDFIKVSRLSRIYYGHKLYHYPLKPVNALANLGILESIRVVSSYARYHIKPLRNEDTFEQWVTNRFGKRLYEIFFKTYTEKVWGIACSEIRSDWAAQRIKGLSLRSALTNALFGSGAAKSLIETFHYPRRGPGQMWQRFRDLVEDRGGEVRLGAEVTGIETTGSQVSAVRFRCQGAEEVVAADHVISSMPLPDLVRAVKPGFDASVLCHAAALRYRAFLIVVLVLDRPQIFPDQWIYVHAPGVRVGRIQNFKNWSAEMVANPSTTSLGMEYFCDEGDVLWNESDRRLGELAATELESLGLAPGTKVVDRCILRQPKAYPVYDEDYKSSLAVLRGALTRIERLQTVGRNGMHRYNNMDHSMLTGMLAARNIMAAGHNLWGVNEDLQYHEGPDSSEDIRVRIARRVLDATFAPIHKVAFAVACSVVAALLVLLATAAPVLSGNEELRPYLALLMHYLPGYRPTLAGALLATTYAAAGGAIFGWVFAWLRNAFLALSMFNTGSTDGS